MKKLFYSTYTKIAISILCVVSILSAVSFGLHGIRKWDEYNSEVYLFESRFEDSYFLSNVVNSTSYDMYIAATRYINDKTSNPKTYLDNNIDSNHMDYYLSIDGKEFTNTKDKSQNHPYYYQVTIHKDGKIEEMNHPYIHGIYIDVSEVENHHIEMYLGLKPEYITTCESIWNEQKAFLNGTILNITYWGLAALACLIYLFIVVGKDEKGNKKTHGIDRMFIEVNFVMIATIIGCGILLIHLFIKEYVHGDFPFELLHRFTCITVMILVSVLLTLVLSLVRNLKNRTFFSQSLTFIILKKVIEVMKAFINECKTILSNHMSLAVAVILFVYTAIIGLLGHESYYDGFYVIVGIILFLIVSYGVMNYLVSLNRIKEGVNKIRNGELDYKIDKIKYKDLDMLKDGINDISNGLQASVNKTLKAERMKTELITNVSHDLKTPLTSIISYTTLLSNVENLPEEAKDYIAIIDKKSQRLKSLTQDLFDISKVQSGNEEIVLETLNVETLLSQSLAEYEKELENLTVCTKIEENLHILSDGRKMSRVINNLLINISKYTLPHTRVFIDAYSQNDKVIIETKNISNYPLDFDKEEIMQRFKRGDESRSEEGHGLGLAIVKSYVEVTGGTFDITLDGDMFKTVIKYSKV